jgi:Zn-dependent M28 family amino/carboxypeptidase
MKHLYLFALAAICSGCLHYQPSLSPSTPSPQVVETSTLEDTVRVLAAEIGERNLGRYDKLEQTRDYITRRLETAGYKVELQEYQTQSDKRNVYNLVATKAGNDEIVVIGAHYDTMTITPGANDNGSGVAVLLQLAERLKDMTSERTVRFVFFVNEEPPYFMTSDMGSTVYAKQCAQRKDNIVGMLSLETMGYYTDEPASQHFPPGITGYPDTGNFLAFVAEPNSQELLDICLENFEGLPVESLVAPAELEGVSWSDHASFWRYGYQGVMVTDTAPFRYPHYHRETDTPDKLNYRALGLAARGLESVVRALAHDTGASP